MRYGASLATLDAYIVNGQRALIETCWLPALDSRSINVFIEAMETRVSPGCAIFTHEFRGGGLARGAGGNRLRPSPPPSTRRGHCNVRRSSDESEERRHQRWARAALAALNAMALPGGYPNMLAGSDVERATMGFGRNAERLIRAKWHYDPDNVFRSAIPLPVDRSSGRASAAANARKGACAGARRELSAPVQTVRAGTGQVRRRPTTSGLLPPISFSFAISQHGERSEGASEMILVEAILSASALLHGRAAQSAARSVVRTFKRCWAACMAWRRERAAIIELSSMSDRELRDIGVNRCENPRAGPRRHGARACVPVRRDAGLVRNIAARRERNPASHGGESTHRSTAAILFRSHVYDFSPRQYRA